ncbi:hypothetical protein VPH35_113579 [Triticum aestivum]
MGAHWTRRAPRDRVEALDLVAQIAYVRGGSAGRERGDVGSAREGHGGRGDEEVAKDLCGGAKVATARGDNRGRCVTHRHDVAAAMADAEAARGERLVLSGSSGASDARGTCGTHWCGRARWTRRVHAGSAGRRGTPGVCRRRREAAACVAGAEKGRSPWQSTRSRCPVHRDGRHSHGLGGEC